MDFDWLNPPPRWSGDARGLELETGGGTDFWRETFYGFVRDSGHAWLAPVAGDFSLSVRFRGGYAALYDQAGLMLRRDAEDEGFNFWVDQFNAGRSKLDLINAFINSPEYRARFE